MSLSEIGDTASEVGAAAYDVAILRPLSAAALAIGPVFFVVSLPLVAPFERFAGVRTAWDVFVYAPYEYVFVRDIGDF